MDQRQVRLHAQLDLRVRRGQQGASKVAGKYKVAPLPTFEGGGKAGILGGHNSVISVYTKNPGLALKFADFYASPAFQKKLLLSSR